MNIEKVVKMVRVAAAKKLLTIICFVIFLLAMATGLTFGEQGTATLGLGEMSLEQLQAQKDKLRKETEQARLEIDSILAILNRKKEIEEREKEKGDVLDPYSAQHQVEVLKPEVDLLQRQLDALLEKERLLVQRLSLIQRAQEAKLRIIEFQREPKFPNAWVGFGMLADGKSGTGTDSAQSQFFAEIGMRIPVVAKWAAIGPFIGAYHNKWYGGIEGFIPVVTPEQGIPYGSWVELGIAYNEKASALFGLRVGDERWQLLFRYWAGVDIELPLQFGVACLF
jgi:hypothetical protein